MRYHITPVRMAIIKKIKDNKSWQEKKKRVGKDVEKKEFWNTVGESVNWYC